jgi:hypothetical protein
MEGKEKKDNFEDEGEGRKGRDRIRVRRRKITVEERRKRVWRNK